MSQKSFIQKTADLLFGPEIAKPAADTHAPARRASVAYDSAGQGRRAKAWNASKEGSNSLLFANAETIRDRSRDAVRKNPWASNALDSYVANAIGTGIKPQSLHADEAVRDAIHKAWNRWTDEADAFGATDFYGLQAQYTRSQMEAGECFIRFRDRRPEDGLSVPLQLQGMEADFLPYTASTTSEAAGNNKIRNGIEFDGINRRAAYHLYKEHPFETVFSSADAWTTTRVPANQIIHFFRPDRIGQTRGLPHLANVLVRLYELDQCDDATLLRQKIAALFAGFITKNAPEDPVTPEDEPDGLGGAIAGFEPGTLQVLLPGESITFPNTPDSSSYVDFVRGQLRAIAAGIGITYEQLTGDLSGVNYSSIRAGLVEFRRKCEQFQYGVIVFQLCRPVFNRWLNAAVLSGALSLPGYADDPTPYHEVRWNTPGWEWVDPLKDVEAKVLEIRNGLDSRARVVSGKGEDVERVDAENAADQKRSDSLGLKYDSDGRNAKNGSGPTSPAQQQRFPTDAAAEVHLL